MSRTEGSCSPVGRRSRKRRRTCNATPLPGGVSHRHRRCRGADRPSRRALGQNASGVAAGLVFAIDQVEHRAPRLEGHAAQRGIEETCTKRQRAAGSEMARARVARKRRRRSSAPARDAVGSSSAQQIASSEQAASLAARSAGSPAAGSANQRATDSGPHWPDRCRACRACRAGAANFGCVTTRGSARDLLHLLHLWKAWKSSKSLFLWNPFLNPPALMYFRYFAQRLKAL